jgi:hypothetical protein
MIIINPGTESVNDASLEEAIKSAKEFARCLDLVGLKLIRNSKNDDDGFFGFKLKLNNKEVEIDIPGEKSETFLESIPFKSRRCYVNGSSWLFGYGLGSARDKLMGE